jgi:PAS domain S-box-containing protein
VRRTETLREYARTHWQALFALAFGVYSILMVASAYDLRQQLKTGVDTRLVADSRRRAAAISDLTESLRDNVQRYAEAHEMGAYLINRDLGMSMRYGLGASIDDINTRFRSLSAEWARRWGGAPPRIAYVSEDGDVIIDTAPDAGVFNPPPEAGDGVAIAVGPEDGTIVLSAPVAYRGRREGSVVAIVHIGILYRAFLPSNSQGYREFIVAMDGRVLPGQAADGGNQASVLPRAFAPMPYDVVLPLDMQEVQARFADWRWWGMFFPGERVVVASAVPGLPLALATVYASEQNYGHLMSAKTLLALGLVPVLLIGFAAVFYRKRLEAERLQAKVAESEQARLRAEIRSGELASEIARRESLQAALAESEARWQFALEGARDGVWDWNPVTNLLFVSRQWKAMRGLDEGETAGQLEDWSSGVHPDDFPRVLAEVERCVRGEVPYYEAEYRILHKNGTCLWTLDRGKVVERSEDGQALRMIGTNSDISARKAAEAALAAERRRMEITLSLSPDGFIFIDEDRRVAYVNPAAEVLLSRPAEDLVGGDWQRIFTRLRSECALAAECPHELDERQCALWLEEHGELACGAMVRTGPTGNTVLQLSLAGFAGRARVLCLRDVTRETEVDRMKSEFLSTAAHELRSPMASILGFVDLLLKRDYEADKRRELLGIVHQQAEALTKMLNELLDLARIEARAGKDFKFAEHDLCELVRQAAGALLVPGDARRVELKLPDGPVRVRADAEKFRQALTNVLSNAYKFSPLGGAIGLEVLREEGGGAVWAGVRVTDHGMGMTAEEVSRAGERFYRADRTGHIPGTGLGLALVKEILQIHGGSVDIDSAPGEGTRVELWLPEATA